MSSASVSATVALCPALSIDAIVDVSPCVATGLGAYVDAVEVECGRQGTAQAATNADRIVREFLAATGVLSEPVTPSETGLPVYRLSHPIAKPSADAYIVSVTNFERISDGTPYATSDETTLRAEEPFYPMLMSANGYDTQFGYAAELAGQVG